MNRDPNNEILQSWYQFASQQPDSLGSLLELLISRQNKTSEEQRVEFGATPQQYARLQSMRPPREHLFIEDAKRIAKACELLNETAFVQAMVLARNVKLNSQYKSSSISYRAAFDDRGDLDQVSEEE